MVKFNKNEKKIDVIGVATNSFSTLKTNGFFKPAIVNIVLCVSMMVISLLFMYLIGSMAIVNGVFIIGVAFFLYSVLMFLIQPYLQFTMLSHQYRYSMDNGIKFRKSYDSDLHIKGWLSVLFVSFIIFLWMMPFTIIVSVINVIPENLGFVEPILIIISIISYFMGILKTFSYSMVPFIVIDNPNLSIVETLKRSEEIMKGNKLRLLGSILLTFLGVLFIYIIIIIPILILSSIMASVGTSITYAYLSMLIIYPVVFALSTIILQTLIEAYKSIK